jgi:hypothetical protein
LDENGIRIGTAKTLNSNHQAVLNDSFVVKAGTTKSITIAGDSDNNQDAYAGQVAALSLVAVDAGSATVSGTLPITGSVQTVNATLAIGSVTLTRGIRDPGVAGSKEVGVAAYIFSGLRLTAGSNEEVSFKSIRWNQSGSAAAGDLANIKTYIDGDATAYDVVASSDGKYYTTTFATPIKIGKGEYKEVYVKGDIVSGSGRTVDFDLYRYSDIQVLGLTFGYDILPSATDSGDSATDDDGTLQEANPNYDGYEVAIGNGSITVTKATSVAAQNVAENVSGQVLGGFEVEVKGEDITVGKMLFDLGVVEANETLGTDDVTSISLYDASGNVVAGPVDGVAGGVNAISFTDTVTFKVGKFVYTLKGKVGTDFSTNDTIAASTTPSTDWTSVRGSVTANTITPSSAVVTMSTMTVKSAALSVSVSPTPAAQNVVAGVQGYTFANYIFDASSSGEDIRVTSFLPTWGGANNKADELTNCQLFDGTTALNTGSNAINPLDSVQSATEVTFTLDNGWVIPKGTAKTVALKCNILAGSSGSPHWDLVSDVDHVISSGITSGQTFSETVTAGTGKTMTIQSAGTLTVATDDTSPSLKWVQAGATDQTLGVFKVTSAYEDVKLVSMGLQLATSTNANDSMASNTPSDVSKVSLWVGSKKVGEASGFNSTDYATTTFSTAYGATEADYTVAKDASLLITVKADIGVIGTNTSAYPGHLIVVNYDGSSADDEANPGLKAQGMSSGTSVYGTATDKTTNGARIAKAIPTVEKVAMSGTLANEWNTLYRFKITAPTAVDGISLYKFTFDVATSTGGGQEAVGDVLSSSLYRIGEFKVFCYDQPNFTVGSCGSFDNSGLLNVGGLAFGDFSDSAAVGSAEPSEVDIYFNPADSSLGSTKAAITIPSGATRYFELQGNVTGSGTTTAGISVTTKMLGDATFASLNNAINGVDTGGTTNDLTVLGDNWVTGAYIFATSAANVDAWDDDDFIWSGNSKAVSAITTHDWFNGFLVPGMPTEASVGQTLSK